MNKHHALRKWRRNATQERGKLELLERSPSVRGRGGRSTIVPRAGGDRFDKRTAHAEGNRPTSSRRILYLSRRRRRPHSGPPQTGQPPPVSSPLPARVWSDQVRFGASQEVSYFDWKRYPSPTSPLETTRFARRGRDNGVRDD